MLLNGRGTIDTNGFDATFKGIDFAYGTLHESRRGHVDADGRSEGGFGYIVVEQGRLVVNGANPGDALSR